MRDIIFIAKTNLNNDGRILNQIKILNSVYSEKMSINFILLADKPVDVKLAKNINIIEIKPVVRNSKFFRPLVVIEFTFRSIFKLIKLKPKVIHVQDFAVVLPVYLYKLFLGRKTRLIYDDHEMPNEKESIYYRLLQSIERKIMKMSEIVIYANKERQEILDSELGIKNSSYFLNLPYFDDALVNSEELTEELRDKYECLNSLKKEGYKLVIHQGLLEEERGRKKLAYFCKRIEKSNYRIVIVGISFQDFNSFLTEFDLNDQYFVYVGSVAYKFLDVFWKLADMAIVMYLPTYINNRLCAPNRYFIALKNSIPTLVNRDNPVLYNFTEKYSSGFYIEDINEISDLDKICHHNYKVGVLDDLKKEEISKFLSIYENFI